MNSRFNFVASTLSNPELQERIDNRQKYLPETIEASVAELQNRGTIFSDEEIQVINEDIQAQRENAALSNIGQGLFSNGYQNNIVEDPEAPNLYSRRAIYFFTLFFGALFGSIMLAINAGKVKTPKASLVWLFLFSFGLTAVQVIISSYVSTGTSTGFLFGLIAAFCLDFFFWDRCIGNTTMYRAKPIWVPLAIALILIVLIFLAAIYGKG